jgi:RNA polymerase sigma factor (sigma-70 family)
MSSAGTGDPWIRAALEQFEGPLLRYTRSITGDLESARDVVQDAFLRLCTQPRDRLEARVGEWLFTVCRNRALDVRKKEGRMQGLDAVELDSARSAEPPPSSVVDARDQVQGLLALVDGLPRNQQEVVRLKFQEGRSYKEIASITGHSVSNVGFLLHTAVKALRARAQQPAVKA